MNDTIKSFVFHKSFVLRIFGTFLLLFSRDADTMLLEILTAEKIPGYQKNMAIWACGVRKEKNLRRVLIGVLKGTGGATPSQQISAANSLTRIGNITSEGISESSIIDLLEVYTHTADQRLYSLLHNLILGERDFQVVNHVARLLAERASPGEELDAAHWEMLTRSLHICFSYRLQGREDSIRQDMNSVQHSDKEREQVEKLAFYIRRVVDLARDVKEEMKRNLLGKQDQVVHHLSTTSINRGYHEKCSMQTRLKPLLAYVVDPRPGIRAIALKELSDIVTPVAYNYYKELGLRKARGFPDSPAQAIATLGALSQLDSDALAVLLTMISEVCEAEISPLLDEIMKLLSLNEPLKNRLIHEIKSIVDKGDYSDKMGQELVAKILGSQKSPDVISFLIEMVLDEKKYSISIRKRSMKVLLRHHRPDFPQYAEISRCIKDLSREDADQELRQFIFKEIKESPNVDNISYLQEGIFDPRDEVRKAAFRSYCDLVKQSQIGKDKALFFFTSLLSHQSLAAIDIKFQVIDFMKTYEFRTQELKQKILLLLNSDQKELRNSSFELLVQWLKNPVDENEGLDILRGLMDVLKSPGFPFEDVYTRIARVVNDGFLEGSPFFEAHVKDIFLGIQDGLSGPLEHYQIKILCEILDNVGSGNNKTAQLQANWIMENLLKKQSISPAVSLHILQFLINKEGKIVQYFPRLLEYLKMDDSYAKRVSLEILAGSNVFSQRWSAEEKMKAMRSQDPKEVCEYVKWEASLNRNLLPILLKTMGDPSTDKDTMILILAIIRRIESARGELGRIFSFQDARFGDAVRERVLESVAFLMYPPFSESELQIIRELQKIASDVSIGPNYRLASLLALVQISSPEFYDFFRELAGRDEDRQDIRRLALQGLNTIRNPEAVPFYLTCLNNPRYGHILRETVVDGLRDCGSESIIEPLLKIAFSEEKDPVAERAKNALIGAGYSEAVEIGALFGEIRRKEDELKAAQQAILQAKTGITSNDAELLELRIEIGKLSDEISAKEAQLKEEKRRSEEERQQWELKRQKIENRLRELAPEWPNEKKIPKEMRESFLVAKEEYITFEREFEQHMNELGLGSLEIESTIQEHKDHWTTLQSRKERCEENLKRLEEEARALKTQIDSLTQQIKGDEEHYTGMSKSFKDKLPNIESDNLNKAKTYQDNRMREWKNRWEYYSRLVKLSGIAGNAENIPVSMAAKPGPRKLDLGGKK